MKQKQKQQPEREKTLTTTAKSFFFVILLCTISLTSALTIQELISSYSFDYTSDAIQVTNITDSPNPNTLTFTINVASATPDTYTSYIDLEDTNNIVSAESTNNLTSSPGTIQINISTYSLSGADQFDYTLRIYDGDNSLVYRQGNLTTNIYSNYDSGYSILGITDSNMNNDFLRLNVSINSSISSSENVSVFLEYGDEVISSISEQNLSVGINNVILDFDNETIKSTHHNGAYNITGILIGEKLTPFNHATSNYDFKDFAKTSYLSGYDSSFVDSNSDNLTDYLEFEFDIEVKDAGDYRVLADVYDLYGQYLVSINESKTLSVGSRNISSQVNGSLLYSLGVNGPYMISLARLEFNGNKIDHQRDAHVTNITSYYDFARPPLPDLEIFMVNNSGNIEVEIKNSGDADAFGVIANLFDSGDFEKTNIIGRLSANQTYSFNITLNKPINGNLIGVVDFNNLVDEKNESNNLYVFNPTSPSNNIIQVAPFKFRNKKGAPVATFDFKGGLRLKGACFFDTNCIAPENSLLFQNSENETTAYIDEFGNLCLETNSCENFYQSSCNPVSDAFIVRDNSGNNLSYIDFNGDLCLTGKLKDRKPTKTQKHKNTKTQKHIPSFHG